jgi:hypothetical protein
MKASSPSSFRCVLAEKEYAGELQRKIKEQIETVGHVKTVQGDSNSNDARSGIRAPVPQADKH